MHYQFRKKAVQKSSSSSIKLPKIDKRLSLLKSPTNTTQLNHYSLQIINIHQNSNNKKDEINQPLLIDRKYRKSSKQKLKNKISSVIHKIQHIEQEPIESLNNPQNSSIKNIIDNNLKNFKKYILDNKQQIHQQIHKKIYFNKINRNNDNNNIAIYKFKSNKNKSQLIDKQKIFDNQISIFNDIHKIINKSNVTLCTIDRNEVEKKTKMIDLKKSLKKLSPQKSFNQLKKDAINQMKNNDHHEKIVLKDENNYYEWRRVNMNSKELSSFYSQSTLDIENQRLSKLTLQTEASLSNYLQTQKHLLQLKSSALKQTDDQYQ